MLAIFRTPHPFGVCDKWGGVLLVVGVCRVCADPWLERCVGWGGVATGEVGTAFTQPVNVAVVEAFVLFVCWMVTEEWCCTWREF